MESASTSVPSQAKSDSLTKPLILAGAAFLAAAGVSFLYLRSPAPESAAHPHKKQPIAVARDDARPQNELQRERLLESVGSVSSIYLYQSYLNVGLIADAVKNDTYTKEEAAELLGTVVALLQTVDAQMQKLESIGLDQEEVAAVKQVRSISGLIKSQTSLLQTHWKAGDKGSLDRFLQVRHESWNELRDVLGLAAPTSGKDEP
jgi:hypothetical protein